MTFDRHFGNEGSERRSIGALRVLPTTERSDESHSPPNQNGMNSFQALRPCHSTQFSVNEHGRMDYDT